MKNSIIIIAVLLLVTAGYGFMKYNSDDTQKTVNYKFDIPELLDRNEELAKMPEWLGIKQEGQNLYQKVRLTGDAKSALYLAAIYMQEARVTGDHPYYYNAALDVLDIVIDNPPKESILQYQALVSKASVMLSQHHFEEALTIGKEAIKIENKDAQVYGILCDANVELGDYEGAVAMADKMISIKPDLRSYARVSYLRELHGDINGAIEAMKLAVSAGVPSHENTAWARTTLANLYLQYGQLENATKELHQCLSERPDYPFALSALADISVHKLNNSEAQTYIDKAIDLMPEFSFYEQKAVLKEEEKAMKEFEEIKSELLVMLQEDTESGHNMSMELANVYLSLFDDPAKALDAVKNEYELRPNNIEVNKLMGKIHYYKNDFSAAVKYFEKASITNWKSPELLCLHGLSICKSGDVDQGKGFLAEAMSFKPYLDDDLITEVNAIL